MKLRKSLRTILIAFIVLTAIEMSVNPVYAFTYFIFSPSDGSDLGGVKSTDIVDAWYGNDGTYLYFQVQYETTITGSSEDLHIYLDCGWKNGGDADHVNADYVLDTGAMPGSGSWQGILYSWNEGGGTWDFSATVSCFFTTGFDNQTEVYIQLSDIDYGFAEPGDMGILFSSYTSAVTPDVVKHIDYAPDSGTYNVFYVNISQFPGLTLPIFIAAVTTTVALYGRKTGLWRRIIKS